MYIDSIVWTYEMQRILHQSDCAGISRASEQTSTLVMASQSPCNGNLQHMSQIRRDSWSHESNHNSKFQDAEEQNAAKRQTCNIGKSTHHFSPFFWFTTNYFEKFRTF